MARMIKSRIAAHFRGKAGLSFKLVVAVMAAHTAAISCSGTQTRQAASAGAPAASKASEAAMRFKEGEAILADHGFEGTFVYRAVGDRKQHAAFPGLAGTPFIPASTFKIPNTLIGLETGVIPNEHFALPWDGIVRGIDAWNHDQDLASAMAGSVVWFYQEVARRIGLERMQDWVLLLDYGNTKTGDSVDTFWLEGPLTVSARQQVEFLERLTAGRLPVSARSVDILKNVMPSRQMQPGTVFAKTGTYVSNDACHAWLVGWVEQSGDVAAHFALLLKCSAEDVPGRDTRWELVEQLLESAGIAHGSDPECGH